MQWAIKSTALINKKEVKTKVMLFICILCFIAGAIVDNRFAPKVTIVDGEVKLQWADKKKTPKP